MDPSAKHPLNADEAPGSRTPHLLRAARNGWIALGHTLGKVTTPVVLALLYFAILTPMAWVLRLCGHDALGLRRRANSYWIVSTGVKPDSFRQQF